MSEAPDFVDSDIPFSDDTVALAEAACAAAGNEPNVAADPPEESEQNADMQTSAGVKRDVYPPALIITAAEIFPRPSPTGIIRRRDGTVYHVKSVTELVTMLNAQHPKARIDFDHATEISVNNYAKYGSAPNTAAAGWVEKFYAMNGKVVADLHLNYAAADGIRSRAFRYLSPTVFLKPMTREIARVSSIALTNAPALRLKELNTDLPQTKEPNMTDLNFTDPAAATAELNATLQNKEAELNATAQKLEAAEKQIETNTLAEINTAIESGISAGSILPAERDLLLASAQNHKDGLAAGKDALLNSLAARSPQHADLQKQTHFHVPTKNHADALTWAELNACKLTNTSPEAFREMKKLHPDDRKVIEGAVLVSRDQTMGEIGKELNFAGGAANMDLAFSAMRQVVELNAGADTADLIVALNRTFRNDFNVGFNKPKTFWMQLCMVIPSTGPGNVYGVMDDFHEMREWVGDRTVRTIKSTGQILANKDYELTIGVKENDIRDDNVGIYMPRFRRLGESAARKRDSLVRDLIISGHSSLGMDGQNFFDIDHPTVNKMGAAATYANRPTTWKADKEPWIAFDLSREYKPFIMQEREPIRFVALDSLTDDPAWKRKEFQYGVDCRMAVGYGQHHLAYVQQDDLTGATFEAVVEAMTGQLGGPDGKSPLGVNPTHILISPALRYKALKLFKSPGDTGTGDNAYFNAVDIIDTEWLTGHKFS